MSQVNSSAINKGFKGKGNEELLVAPSSPVKQSIVIYQADIKNNSGSDSTMGYGYKMIDSKWGFGQLTGSTLTDDTIDAQSTAVGDVELRLDNIANGIMASCSEPFNLLGFTVATVETGTSILKYEYWNGTSWSELNAVVAPDFSTVGDTALVFSEPMDWALGGSGTNVPADKFNLRIIPTTAASVSPIASYLWVSRLLDLIGKVVTGSAINKTQYVISNGSRIPPGHAVVPYSSISDSSNSIYLEYTYAK